MITKNIIFLVGIPGSGKSTWARNFVLNKNQAAIILSRDSLRNMRGNYNIPFQESMITEWMKSLFKISLNYKEDIIIDNTNLKKEYFHPFLMAIYEFNEANANKDFKFDIKVKVFNTSLDECIERNLYIRPENERVPINVVKSMFEQYKLFISNLDLFLPVINGSYYID